jgi:hypothetical protein
MTYTSPDVRNYQYGAGAMYLKVDGIDNSFRHVGNAPTLNYSSTITEVDHKQSMSGLKSVDDSFVSEVAAEIQADLEEVTPENMELFVFGTGSTETDGEVVIGGLTLTDLKGDLRYVSDNSKGRNFVYEARVAIRPNGDFSFITDGVNKIPLKFKVLKSDGKFGTWTFQPV